MRKNLLAFLFLFSLFLVLPLAGCSPGEEPVLESPVLKSRVLKSPVLESKEDAFNRAKELFPEFFQGDRENFEIQHSREEALEFGASTLLHENSWKIAGQSLGKTSGYIRIEISADDGSLLSLSYHPDNSQEFHSQKLLSRKEAEKTAYTFACKYQPEKMAYMVSNKDLFEYANDGHPNLEYTFGWNRVINGIPADGNGITVSVDALTGKVTEFDCTWNEVDPAPAQIVSSKEITEKIINQVGLYPFYIAKSSQTGIPRAKLVYIPNTVFHRFYALTGNPVPYFFTRAVPLVESKQFNQEFTPVPAPEQQVHISLPDKRLSVEECRKKAVVFLDRLGIKGDVIKGGHLWDSGYPYPEEQRIYQLHYLSLNDSPWEEVEIWIDSATGEANRFSRLPKKEKKLFPFLQLSLEEAEQSALKFLETINEDTGNMVLHAEPWSFFDTGEKMDICSFTWYRLVNGVPYQDDRLTVSVSLNTGEVLGFERDSVKVNSFESTKDILSPQEAAAIWRKSEPLQLRYGLTAYPYPYQGNMKLSLLYNLENFVIDAHTGTKIELDVRKKLGPYLAKIQGHWAEIPLDLLAQTGLLPDPEVFTPNQAVTRRECLRILESEGNPNKDSFKRLYSPFSDVSVNDQDIWAILNAVWCNIIEPGGSLRPDAPLTREDAALWLVNLVMNKQTSVTLGQKEPLFQDRSKISPDKRKHVATAQELGLIGGDSKGNFRPQDPVTWGELAAMLAKATPRL